MWALAVTRLSHEFTVRDQLKLECFLPYSFEKRVTKVTPSRTTSTPRPRAQHVVTRIKVARWPGYLFARVQSSDDLNTLQSAKGVLALVRNGEGEASRLPESVMVTLRRGCAPDGLVLKQAELHGFEVGEMLRFVATSSLSGRAAKVLSLGDNGSVRVEVDGRINAEVHYSELTDTIR